MTQTIDHLSNEWAAVDWLHRLAPQPALAIRTRKRPNRHAEWAQYMRAYADTPAAVLAERVGLQYGGADLALLILQIADPFGSLHLPHKALDVAERRIAATLPPADVVADIRIVTQWLRDEIPRLLATTEQGCNPGDIDATEQGCNPGDIDATEQGYNPGDIDASAIPTFAHSPLLAIAHKLAVPAPDNEDLPRDVAHLLDVIGNHCAHILARGGQSDHIASDASAIQKFVHERRAANDIDILWYHLPRILRGIKTSYTRQTLKRIYLGRDRLFQRRKTSPREAGDPITHPARPSRAAERERPGAEKLVRDEEFNGLHGEVAPPQAVREPPSMPHPRHAGQPQGGHPGTVGGVKGPAGAVRNRRWRGDDDDRDPFMPPLSVSAATGIDELQPEDDDDPIGAGYHEHLADMSIESNAACLPGSALSDIVGWLTASATTPAASTATFRSRWTVVLLCLLLGIPPTLAVDARYEDDGDSLHDTDARDAHGSSRVVRYDAARHLLHIPSERLKEAWGEGHNIVDGFHDPSQRDVTLRPPAVLCAHLVACVSDARRLGAGHPDAPRRHIFWADTAYGPRPLRLADVTRLCAVFSDRLSVPITPNHIVGAWEAIALRIDGPVPPVVLAFLSGQPDQWEIPVTYLALPGWYLDTAVEDLSSFIVTHVLRRQRLSDEREPRDAPPIAVAWLDAPDHAAVHRALPDRTGLFGSPYHPNLARIAQVSADIERAAHRASLMQDRRVAATAWARCLDLKLRTHAFLRRQDVIYLDRSDVVPLPEGMALIVQPKPGADYQVHPRLLYAAVPLADTLARYLSYTTESGANDRLLPALVVDNDRNAGLPYADSCRHLLSSYAVVHARDIAREVGYTVVEVTYLVQWWLGHDDIHNCPYGRRGDGLETAAANVIACIVTRLTCEFQRLYPHP